MLVRQQGGGEEKKQKKKAIEEPRPRNRKPTDVGPAFHSLTPFHPPHPRPVAVLNGELSKKVKVKKKKKEKNGSRNAVGR